MWYQGGRFDRGAPNVPDASMSIQIGLGGHVGDFRNISGPTVLTVLSYSLTRGRSAWLPPSSASPR